MTRMLVTGALGQIGSELVPALQARSSEDAVVAVDIRPSPNGYRGHFVQSDCTKHENILDVVKEYNVGTIYHLSAVLSSVAEDDPGRAWRINMDSLFAVLEVAAEEECAVFVPSSIAAFGPTTPKRRTPQETVQRPSTMYGVTKVAGELLCDYYHLRYGVDTRGVRFPGLASHATLPGGGTTDYVVEIFRHAIATSHYSCYLAPRTQLDMMYMPDAVRAVIELMDAHPTKLRNRNAYNITAMSITPELLAREIQQHLPDFTISYDIDPKRQAIADSWPNQIDDQRAHRDWGWRPRYGLSDMAVDMIKNLRRQNISLWENSVCQ